MPSTKPNNVHMDVTLPDVTVETHKDKRSTPKQDHKQSASLGGIVRKQKKLTVSEV